jgi:hypothetical protein
LLHAPIVATLRDQVGQPKVAQLRETVGREQAIILRPIADTCTTAGNDLWPVYFFNVS